MSDAALHYEIRTASAPDGGVRLELWVEKNRTATATTSRDVLDGIQHYLGLDHEAVVQELRASLEALLRDQLEKVTISDIREESPLRYVARYTYRDFDDISTGLVRYDVEASETSPEDVPAVIRNKLRHEVHRLLTDEGTHARAIVDLHR